MGKNTRAKLAAQKKDEEGGEPKPKPISSRRKAPPTSVEQAQAARTNKRKIVVRKHSSSDPNNKTSAQNYYRRLASSDRTEDQEYSKRTLGSEAARQLDASVVSFLIEALDHAKGVARTNKRTKVNENDFYNSLRQLALTRGVSVQETTAFINGLKHKFVSMGFAEYIKDKRAKAKLSRKRK